MAPIPAIFFGTPSFAEIILRRLLQDASVEIRAVVTQTDKPTGRGNSVSPSPVKRCALEHGVPLMQPKRIRGEVQSFFDLADSCGPFEVGLVAAFGQILPEEILALPAAGFVNVHASLLPRWRGAAPIHRALIAGDTSTGVCLMKMEAGLDTGPVYCCQQTSIEASDNFGSLHDRLASMGASLLSSQIEGIVSGTILPRAQPESGIVYAEKLAKEEEQIDWSRPASEINNLVRALSPAPGAYTLFNGKRLKVFAAEQAEGSAAAEPGTVVAVEKKQLVVSCGTESLSIISVQPEGKRRMEINEFLSGAKPRLGTLLGK